MLQLPFTLDSTRSAPLYQQLYEALLTQIRSGALPAGTRLPGKRTLAGQLAVGGEHGGHRLPDALGGGLSGEPGAQRLLCPGGHPPPGRPRARRASRPGGGAGRARPPVRPLHRVGGHGPLPLPHLGTHPAGAALRRPGAPSPRPPPGGPGAAGGHPGVPGHLPGGGCATALSWWWGPGWSTCWGWRPHLLKGGVAGHREPRLPAGADDSAQHRPRLPVRFHRPGGAQRLRPGGERGQPLLRHPQPPLPHRRHHARRAAGGSCSAGPRRRRGGTSLRTTTTRSSASTPDPSPASRAWGDRAAR